MMTPNEAEKKVAKYFSGSGHFATLLKKGIDGNQPFDLIAIGSSRTFCVDVKLCQKDYFTFDRVEDNQQNSFKFLKGLRNPNLWLGFFIIYEGIMYYLTYEEYIEKLDSGAKSVKITRELRKVI